MAAPLMTPGRRSVVAVGDFAVGVVESDVLLKLREGREDQFAERALVGIHALSMSQRARARPALPAEADAQLK
jgi:hypothetical protein